MSFPLLCYSKHTIAGYDYDVNLTKKHWVFALASLVFHKIPKK